MIVSKETGTRQKGQSYWKTIKLISFSFPSLRPAMTHLISSKRRSFFRCLAISYSVHNSFTLKQFQHTQISFYRLLLQLNFLRKQVNTQMSSMYEWVLQEITINHRCFTVSFIVSRYYFVRFSSATSHRGSVFVFTM